MTSNQTDDIDISKKNSELGLTLVNSGLNSIRGLVVLGPHEISHTAHISLEKATIVYDWAKSKLANHDNYVKGLSVASILQGRLVKPKISTGSNSIDSILYGGIETGAITEFFGPSGSGKTQMCFTLAVNAQSLVGEGPNCNVIYIDCENKFSAERICGIADARNLDVKKITENIKLFRCHNTWEQERCIVSIPFIQEQLGNVKLLIVDSMISNYRSEYTRREYLPERQHRIYKSMKFLSNIAQIYDLAVVVTNQIQASPDYLVGNKTVSSGGNVMAHASTYRIELLGNFLHTAKVVSSPCHPPSKAKFSITDRGICD